MYIGHGRLYVRVCLSVPRRIPTLLQGPGCNLGEWYGKECPLVVNCWADLQSVHGFCCYYNTDVCKLIVLYTASAQCRTRNVSECLQAYSLYGWLCQCRLSHQCNNSIFFQHASSGGQEFGHTVLSVTLFRLSFIPFAPPICKTVLWEILFSGRQFSEVRVKDLPPPLAQKNHQFQCKAS